ncbi:hypothetical protein Droror1_Dr00010785 [Drosera rotundifolia]
MCFAPTTINRPNKKQIKTNTNQFLTTTQKHKNTQSRKKHFSSSPLLTQPLLSYFPMELLFELAITLSLSFIFTFILAKLAFPDYSSLSHSSSNDDDDLENDVASKSGDDPIKKLMIDELYFDSKHGNDKFGFSEGVIKVHRVSIIEETVEIEEREESDEFGGVREVVVVDEEEEKAEFSGVGDELVGHYGGESAVICGIEIQMINEADRVDRVADRLCDCDRVVEFDDDWEAIERDDFEEMYSNQGVFLVDEFDDENSKIDEFWMFKNSKFESIRGDEVCAVI